MNFLGDFTEDETVYIMFNTFSSNDPSASCTITNLTETDVHIHKDDGVAQRNNAAGITVSVDFDGITGSHLVKIDTSDNTVAGFWVAGHEYFVRIEGTTIDGATINSVIGHFSIENRFMRGTDSAALAATALTDVTWTDAKAAFLDHAISTIDTNVDTLISRITAAVALASICTETRLAELDAANLPTDVADIPNNSEFNARTLPTADYVVTSDTIAGVTTATNLTNAPTSGDLTAVMKTSIESEISDALKVDTIPDSYAADGSQPTIVQAILAIHQMMQEKSISGTTLTVKKPDGSTSAMTFTLDSSTAPTEITRAT